MIKVGKKKPSYEGNTILYKALIRYTEFNSINFDEMFTRDVFKIAPDWISEVSRANCRLLGCTSTPKVALFKKLLGFFRR